MVSSKQLSDDEDKHIFIQEETLDLPSNHFGKLFIDRRSTKMSTYWCKDEMGSFYVIRKSLLGTDPKGRYINKI
jgi:hypothetical protein